MNIKPKNAYINQPIPIPENGEAFRVCFPNGVRTELMTKTEAEEILNAYNNKIKKSDLVKCIALALSK